MKQYRCKYDPMHGDFGNPGMLGLHYKREHPEHIPTPNPSPRIYTCRTCGVEAKWPNAMRNHVMKVHPALVTEPYHREDYADARLVGEPARTPARRPEPRAEPEVVHWDVDDIVLPVLTQLTKPHATLALDKLPAVFAWRDATVEMLHAVQE